VIIILWSPCALLLLLLFRLFTKSLARDRFVDLTRHFTHGPVLQERRGNR